VESNLQENKNISSESSMNAQLVCPYCQIRGYVLVKSEKYELSRPEFSAFDWFLALVTGGVWFLIRAFTDWTGGPYSEWRNIAHCDNCGQSWNMK
jgi:hypothetical protein